MTKINKACCETRNDFLGSSSKDFIALSIPCVALPSMFVLPNISDIASLGWGGTEFISEESFYT